MNTSYWFVILPDHQLQSVRYLHLSIKVTGLNSNEPYRKPNWSRQKPRCVMSCSNHCRSFCSNLFNTCTLDIEL